VPLLDQCAIATRATQNGSTWDLVGTSWDVIEAEDVPVTTEFVLLVSVVMSLEEAMSDHVLAVTLRGPSNAPLGGMSARVVAPTPEQLQAGPDVGYWRAESILNARGVTLPEFGRYDVVFEWDGEALREPMPLSVIPPRT
jgi:hypothetical protein